MNSTLSSVKDLTSQITVQVRKECEDAFNGPNAKVTPARHTDEQSKHHLWISELHTESTLLRRV
jgi:hypothetical protein